MKHLKVNGSDDAKLGTVSNLILEETRKHLVAEPDRLAKAKSMDDVTAERVKLLVLEGIRTTGRCLRNYQPTCRRLYSTTSDR